MGFMPRGIFGMRLVLVVKVVCGSWFVRHSPLNAALALLILFHTLASVV
ncbi:hypothetical protein [Vibrio vulnificus YJ016]|uniref:DUF3265 domain-containing protein n=1 Tax=Vibrio vulnificus (strain YJ016) TaxID=196600 RepID=Q7MKM2_VIBVY|nr:hypothetical protein [Vibrio vulnificus YJ016]